MQNNVLVNTLKDPRNVIWGKFEIDKKLAILNLLFLGVAIEQIALSSSL